MRLDVNCRVLVRTNEAELYSKTQYATCNWNLYARILSAHPGTAEQLQSLSTSVIIFLVASFGHLFHIAYLLDKITEAKSEQREEHRNKWLSGDDNPGVLSLSSGLGGINVCISRDYLAPPAYVISWPNIVGSK